MGLDVQPGHAGKTVPGLAVHPRVFDECPVVGDDYQRERAVRNASKSRSTSSVAGLSRFRAG
jgi:hypothetical protein